MANLDGSWQNLPTNNMSNNKKGDSKLEKRADVDDRRVDKLEKRVSTLENELTKLKSKLKK
ncbi:hypothetical protein [Nitrosotalea sinensis]|uniref:hypothetical protein n=1 Tax=Nitrosotalea sinensis TaxID=1499975 RepID=UPI0013FDACBA|nr:hypothetical protein [Candidatus Nitrosotalea sinensis]